MKRLSDGVVRDRGPVKVTSFADGATLDVPGQPRIWQLPGRMRGRCALHLSDASVLFSGDVLVTDDPSTRRSGPRLLVKVNQDDCRHGRPWTSWRASTLGCFRPALRHRGATG